MPKLDSKVIAIPLAALALGLVANAHGAGSREDFSYMTLHGLDRIAVQVEGVHRDFKRYGLEADVVKSAVETRLRDNGLAVVSLDEAKRLPDAALLRVSLNANEDQLRLYFYGISVEIKQKIPVNDAGGFVSRNIWSSGKTGVLDPVDFGRMNGYIADLVGLFLRDFHDQNRPVISATP